MQSDRCPYVAASELGMCRAHEAVVFKPDVPMGEPLPSSSTCRFLTLGTEPAGWPYPRCGIGDESAREDFVQRRRSALDERVSTLLATDLYADKEEAGVMVTDDDGTYVAVNSAMCRMLGYEREHMLLGKSVWDLTPQPHSGNGRALWRDFVDAGESYGTYLLVCQDGTTRAFDYIARANIVPGLHVSILTPASEQPKPGVDPQARPSP